MIPLDEMSPEEAEKSTDYCASRLETKEGYCDRTPSYSDGHCGFHTKAIDTWNDEEQNWLDAYQMPPSPYYQKLPDKDKAFVDSIVQSFLQDAPFDETHHGKMELLRSVAINFHKKRVSNEYIKNTGMTKEVTTDYRKEFGPIKDTEENPLHLTVSRLSRDDAKILKELGILDGPDKKQAEATQSLAAVVAQVGLDIQKKEREEIYVEANQED